MKIELMNLIVNELENANIQDVEIAKNIISTYDKEPDDVLKKLLKLLKECQYNNDILKIAIYPCLLEKRTTEDQIKLMKELRRNNYNAEILNIAIDPTVLEEKTTEEQIELMEKLMKQINVKTHSKYLNNINNMKELKKYVVSLKNEYGEKNNIELSDKVEFKVIKKTINENN